jgi:DNA repair protein RecN (Recombination protein N)
MLTHIDIKNFVLIEQLSLDLNAGLTVITGETGAGKSIIMDAIELALGQRADNLTVRQGADQCEITLIFDVQQNSAAEEWLTTHELNSDDECIIRRVISSDGRSRATINNVPSPLQQIKDLASILINIHGQHQHQALLKRSYQRELLDAYANHFELSNQVSILYNAWNTIQTELNSLLNDQQDHSAEITLLTDQIAELEACELQADTYERLDLEHKQLASIDSQLLHLNQAYQLLSQQEDGNVLDQLDLIERALHSEKNLLPQLNNGLELVNSAVLSLQEANSELEKILSSLEPNPERLLEVEKRLEKIHHFSRKHRIKANDLHTVQESLETRLHSLIHSEARANELKMQLDKVNVDYQKAAEQLSSSREKAATKLSKAISAQMQELSLSGATLKIEVQPQHQSRPHPDGQDLIEFLVQTNPNQPLNSLSKVVSGGELSRISLAIHVTTGQQMTIPTQIFDEVDVGIGGPTASIVGELLRQLGTQSQILCITHLPQVAANGHDHLYVCKNTDKNKAFTTIIRLSREQRAQELARMLGDLTLNANAIAHAENLLSNAEAIS